MHDALPFFTSFAETKSAKPRGPGQSPGGPVFQDARFQRVDAGLPVAVILSRRKFLQIPLVAILVVHPVGDNSLNLLAGVAVCDHRRDLVLHMAEETLLRPVVPAVSLSGYGLDEGSVFEFLDEGIAGIVAALIAVNNGYVAQFSSVLATHGIYHLEDEAGPEIAA